MGPMTVKPMKREGPMIHGTIAMITIGHSDCNDN